MVLIDDEPGAWRNSEVARVLVAMLEEQACMCDDEVPAEAMPPVHTEMHTDDDGNLIVEIEEKTPMEAVRAELDLHHARVQLSKLANAAIASGNIKAAYLIERAIEDLN